MAPSYDQDPFRYLRRQAYASARVGDLSGAGPSKPALPYDPVFPFFGDSNVLTQGDTANADMLSASWPASSRVFVANVTMAGGWDQYAPGLSTTPTVGRTGINFSANKNNPGPEIGFIPKFLDAYSNDLRLLNIAAPGASMGRGAAAGTCTGYVSNGTSGTPGNIFTLLSGTMPTPNTLIVGAGIPAGTMIASFGPGAGNQRYVYTEGSNGFTLSFAAGTSGAPITVTRYGYSFSLSEGCLWVGGDAATNNGYRTRVANAMNALVTAGKNPKIPAIFIMLGTNDMADNTAAGFFSAAMTAYIADLKSLLASYLVPGYRIVMVRVKSGASGSATVRTAQLNIKNGDANVYLMNTDDAAFSLSDGTHYTCPTAPQIYTGRAAIGSSGYDIATGASAGV